MPPAFIPYYRVSTQQQGRSGLGLEAQRTTVAAYVRQAGGTVIAEYTEVESGRRCDRPELAQAVALAQISGATLIVAKLDRLARDARFILHLVDSGVRVAFGDLPELATGDPITGRLILTVLAAIAEFEARRIGQRIREAAAVRRARGALMGARDPRCQHMTDAHRRKGSAVAREVNRAAALAFRRAIRPVVRQLLAQGMTFCQAADTLNARGCTTRRGRAWTTATVHAVMRPLPGEEA